MKPGEGTHGEEKYDERMPAFVRFRTLKPVSELLPGSSQLWPRDLGLGETTLRRFKFSKVRKIAVREAFDRFAMTLPSNFRKRRTFSPGRGDPLN